MGVGEHNELRPDHWVEPAAPPGESREEHTQQLHFSVLSEKKTNGYVDDLQVESFISSANKFSKNKPDAGREPRGLKSPYFRSSTSDNRTYWK